MQLPSHRVLIAAVYTLCVLLLDLTFTAEILFSDNDAQRSQGPVDSLVAVSTFGTVALIIGVGLATWAVRTPERARMASLVLVALCGLSLVFFWSGAPGILGACAAWCAGITRGGRPLGGPARIAGIIGAFIAMLNVALTVGGIALHFLVGRA